MKAVIFDFDGVLVDSERYWPEVTRRIFEEHAVQPWTDDDCRSLTGLGLRQCHERFSTEFGMTMTLADFERYLLDEVAGMYDTHIDMMPGARGLMDRLDSMEIPFAIASSNKRNIIEATTRRLGINGRFRAICTSDDVGERTKPHPDVYLLAAERLGIDPVACIAIEDSTVGIAAAKAAGMRCIALRSPHNTTQDLSAADQHIEEFDGLESLIG